MLETIMSGFHIAPYIVSGDGVMLEQLCRWTENKCDIVLSVSGE